MNSENDFNCMICSNLTAQKEGYRQFKAAIVTNPMEQAPMVAQVEEAAMLNIVARLKEATGSSVHTRGGSGIVFGHDGLVLGYNTY